ncbi:hypothetical protein C2I36_10510 [Rhodobacteraceae bacterium WD3A24]|nr:hypothetical protein C2I36_10510 [Rhodobacteraceae bacterium WD3A24]
MARRGVSTLAISAMIAAMGGYADMPPLIGAAYADTHDDGNQGQGNQGEGGEGRGGSDGGAGQGGSDGGAGQGGPGEDSEGRGPQAGSGGETGGGRPPWAQEGIPEDLELGRLSVARSPDQVLDRAFDEALAHLSPEMIAFYSLDLDEMIEELSLNWDNLTIIDSPLQNLALYKDAMDGTSVLTDMGVTNDTDTLLAAFLGVASDKTVPISTDTVLALSVIFEQPISEADAAALAAEAEAIRIAVLAGHG